MKPRQRGAKLLAAFVPDIIGETLAARGMGQAALIADWPAIVGEEIARHASPIELQWPSAGPKRNPQAPAAASTLLLRVEGAFALEAQHSAAIIIARINAHLGWRCVDRIAFRQGPLPAARGKRAPPQSPSAAAESEARRAASSIEDGDLRDAVTRLGARAIDRSARSLPPVGAAKGNED